MPLDAVSSGDQLWKDAYNLLKARPGMSSVDYEVAARRKAMEIQTWLQTYGEDVYTHRPDMVDALGQSYDKLAKGAIELLEEVKPSPFWSGTKHLASGAATGEVLASAADSVSDWGVKALGKYRGYIMTGVVVVFAGLALWVWGKSK